MCRSVQDTSEQPDQHKTQLRRSIASSYWTRSDSLSDLSRGTYHNRRKSESVVVGRKPIASRTRLCPWKWSQTSFPNTVTHMFLTSWSLRVSWTWILYDNNIVLYINYSIADEYCRIARIHVATVKCVRVLWRLLTNIYSLYSEALDQDALYFVYYLMALLLTFHTFGEFH